MKRFIRKMAIAFLSGATAAIMSIAVSAGFSEGAEGYYNSEGYYYISMNTISTGSEFVFGTTNVSSQKSENYFPTGYVGIEPRVFDANTKKIIASSSMSYNTREMNSFTQFTPQHDAKSGSFYSQGLTRAYTSDTSAMFYPYYQYGTFASPIQSISG